MAFWRSKITEEMVKKATEGYTKACSYPLLANARFEGDFVHSNWSQKCPEIGKKRSFARIFGGTGNSTLPLKYENGESQTIFGKDLQVILSVFSQNRFEVKKFVKFLGDSQQIEKFQRR